MKLLPFEKISNPEAVLVRYYDNRLRKLQGRNELYQAVFIIIIVAIISFVLIGYAFGGTADTATGREIMMPFKPKYVPIFVSNPTDFSKFKIDYTEACKQCATDMECEDFCYDWYEVISD
jgi:hypothetical protein